MYSEISFKKTEACSILTEKMGSREKNDTNLFPILNFKIKPSYQSNPVTNR